MTDTNSFGAGSPFGPGIAPVTVVTPVSNGGAGSPVSSSVISPPASFGATTDSGSPVLLSGSPVSLASNAGSGAIPLLSLGANEFVNLPASGSNSDAHVVSASPGIGDAAAVTSTLAAVSHSSDFGSGAGLPFMTASDDGAVAPTDIAWFATSDLYGDWFLV